MNEIPSRLAAALADRYALVRELGAGGMATVYLADDLKHDRQVAIKVLKPELAAMMGAERFLAEIRTTANLHHPHILPLFDSGEADGFLYYVMPYVRGDSLRARMDREKELAVEEAVSVAVKVAGALHAAHEGGVIHRDVKPENILFQGGEPLVSDFGIALAVTAAGGGRLTETGLSLGTPSYMSPEQATGDRAPDVRSDVYGLGCVVYEMLAGRPPHVGGTAQQVLAKILTEDPAPVTAERKQVPANVGAAVRVALQRVPADRFASARAFGEALVDDSFLGLAGETASSSRGIPLAAAGILAVVGLAAGVGLGRTLASEDGPAPTRIRQLTNTGGVSVAAISPDGRQIALVSGGAAEDETSYRRLEIRTLPAGAPTVLLDSIRRADGLSWASDGSVLLLQAAIGSEDPGVYVVPLSGAPARRLAGEPALQVAFKTPDSVVTFSGGERLMQVLDPTSGEVLRSAELEREVFEGDWSEERQLWAGVYYAPGRLQVAGVLALMDADFTPLDSIPGYPLNPVRWAGPDRVVFVEAGPHEISSQSIMEIGVEGNRFAGTARTLREGVMVWEGDASLDGQVSVMVLHNVVDGVSGADLESGETVRPTRSVGTWITRPALSPDGRTVAVFRNDLLGPNPYMVSFQGGRDIPIGSRAGRLHDRLSWTADGSAIVIHGHPDEPVALYDADAGTERELMPRGVFLGGLQDGRLIFVSGSYEELGDTLLAVDPSSRERRAVGRLPAGTVAGRISPWDARFWVVVAGEDDAGPVVRSLAIGTGEWTEHGSLPAPVTRILAVDPDGFLYWEDAVGAAKIWRWRPGEDVELYREFPFDCVDGYASMTPDARRFVCNASTGAGADAWLLERVESS